MYVARRCCHELASHPPHIFTMAKVGGKILGEKRVETLWTVCLRKVDSKHAKTEFQGKKVDSKHAKTEFQGKKVDSTT